MQLYFLKLQFNIQSYIKTKFVYFLIKTDKYYGICVCYYENKFNYCDHCNNLEYVRIEDINWEKVTKITSSHGKNSSIDKIINKSIGNFVKKTEKLIFIETNPTDAFKYCSIDNRFISTSNVRTIPTEITNNEKITQYKFCGCNSSTLVQTEIFNFLPGHLEVLEIYYNLSDFLIEFFLTTNLNLPLNLKKITLDFRTNYPHQILFIKKNYIISKLYEKIKIPFGCELFINIERDI